MLSRTIADEMIAHCEGGRPNEACGVLASHAGAIVDLFPMKNASASPVRYSLDPHEQLAVYKAIEDKGWDLGGVYHSHTRTEAYPSPTDIRLASEDVPYVIVSLARPRPSIRAFRIVKANWTDEDGEIIELPVTID